MNWYKISQQWESFLKNRQREFPFMHEPGYARKGTPWLEQGYEEFEREEEGNDLLNLYHVTTNLSGVMTSGGLKSRRELGYENVGLGGGPEDQAPNMVSVTYDYNRALQIYNDLIHMLDLVNGKIKASQVLNDLWTNSIDEEALDAELEMWIGKENMKAVVEDGNLNIIDTVVSSPQDVYKFYQSLENTISEQEARSDYTTVFSRAGFTADFASMKKINPSNVAIIQLVAKKNARSVEHVTLEKELRFYSKDLRVIRWMQP